MSITAELADGTTLEFPDGTDPAVIQATVKKRMGMAAAAPAQESTAAPKLSAVEEQRKGIFGGIPEAAVSLGSGALGGLAGGLAGVAGAALPGPEFQGADWARNVQDALTVAPQSRGGKMIVNAISYPFAKLAQGGDVAGGTVTDKTGSPALGAATNTLIQALPYALLPAAGQAAGSALRGEGLGAAGFMRRALKPDKAARETGRDVRAIETALNDTGAPGPAGYNVTRGADEALTERIGNRMDQRDQAVAASGARVPISGALDNLLNEYQQAANDWSTLGQSRRASIQDQWNEVVNRAGGARDVPIQDALAVTRALNRYTNNRYGEPFSPQDVANARAVQSGLSQEAAAASPTVAAVNAEVSPLINLRDMIRERVGASGNRPLVGIGALAHSPLGAMTWLAERVPQVSSILARLLNTTGKGVEAVSETAPAGAAFAPESDRARRKRLAELLGSAQ